MVNTTSIHYLMIFNDGIGKPNKGVYKLIGHHKMIALEIWDTHLTFKSTISQNVSQSNFVRFSLPLCV